MKLSALTVFALSATLLTPTRTLYAQASAPDAQAAKGQQEQLKKEEKANKEKAKAAHDQRKALRQQEKADKASKKAAQPQP